MTLPLAMGSGPLAQPLFYQQKRTIGRAEPLQNNGSEQSQARRSGPGQLISKTIRFGPNRPAPAQPREQACGIAPPPAGGRALCHRSRGRVALPATPNTGPGAEGGGGWLMHATA